VASPHRWTYSGVGTCMEAGTSRGPVCCSEPGRELETNSRPLPPKHQVSRGPCNDQKARKTTTMTWFTKSAKPPSPVQIRAAPPKSLANSQVSIGALQRKDAKGAQLELSVTAASAPRMTVGTSTMRPSPSGAGGTCRRIPGRGDRVGDWTERLIPSTRWISFQWVRSGVSWVFAPR